MFLSKQMTIFLYIYVYTHTQYFLIFYIKGRKECVGIRLILDIFSYLSLKFCLSVLLLQQKRARKVLISKF